MSRTVTVLLTYEQQGYGTIGPFEVASPWWADVEPVVAHVSEVVGVPVAVLRLVDVDGGTPPRDGHVTYHVETLDRPRFLPPKPSGAEARQLLAPEPKRAPYATAGGLGAALAWADDAAAGAGYRRVGPPEQLKTWNLSVVFRLPVAGGDPLWLKITRPFAAHEPDVLGLVAQVDSGLVSTVVASDPENRRGLYTHIPGDDCWDASPELIEVTVRRWVAAQAALAPLMRRRSSADVASARGIAPPLGVPVRSPGMLVGEMRALLAGETGDRLGEQERREAYALADALPALAAAIETCGLPETLVHGDFHPGNWRADPAAGTGPVLLDFADAYAGHPAFDGVRLRDFVAPDRQPAVAAAWCRAWSGLIPGSDPARALQLGVPLQHVAGAALYAMFLDGIEPSERRYHEDDPAAEVRAAVVAWREPSG